MFAFFQTTFDLYSYMLYKIHKVFVSLMSGGIRLPVQWSLLLPAS